MLSRKGLKRVGGFSEPAADGRSAIGVYGVWKLHPIPLSEAILRIRGLGFDVSLRHLYDDMVLDGWKPTEARKLIVSTISDLDGEEMAKGIDNVLDLANRITEGQK